MTEAADRLGVTKEQLRDGLRWFVRATRPLARLSKTRADDLAVLLLDRAIEDQLTFDLIAESLGYPPPESRIIGSSEVYRGMALTRQELRDTLVWAEQVIGPISRLTLFTKLDDAAVRLVGLYISDSALFKELCDLMGMPE